MSLIVILSALVALLLIGIVLVQNPKGGGLASNFSQGTQLFGVERTNDIVEKITWTLGAIVVILSLWAASYNVKPSSKQQKQKAPVEQKAEGEIPNL